MIQINEDFEKAYKDSMAKGFSMKELLALGGAVALLSVFCFCGYFLLHFNLYLSFLAGMVPAGGIVFFGFWRSSSDLNVMEYYQAVRKRKDTELLLWECREYDEEKALYEEVFAALEDRKE